MKKQRNINNRREFNAIVDAENESRSGSIVAVIYSADFISYSVRKLYPHKRFPDRKDLFDWDSEDASEIAVAVFKGGKQLDISNSIAPRKIVVNEFPMN